MIDMSLLPLFLVAAFFLVISPGPDLVLISTYSSSRGFIAGLMVTAGIFVAGLVQTMLVAFGLGQLMMAMPPLVLAVKVVGALYLSWLGINMLRSWFKREEEVTNVSNTVPLKGAQLFNYGLVNNLMNPKALLFFSLFLPQFTTAELSLTPQILTLGVLLSVVALLVNTFFALCFSKLGHYLSGKVKLGRHFDGILGVLFLGLAARLISTKS